MQTLIVCPRCRGSLQPSARACPRCGLVLSAQDPATSNGSLLQAPSDQSRTYGPASAADIPATQTVDYSAAADASADGTLPYSDTYGAILPQGRSVKKADHIGPAPAASSPVRLVPRGAIELLPNESVAFQLGALYLTNKRVILLSPSIVRAAFLHDVDAVGTLTERSSAWSLFFGMIFLGLAGSALYLSFDAESWEPVLPWLFWLDPSVLAAAFGVAAVLLFAVYFLWVKRTLFISVKGRPLITVSISQWNSRGLTGIDDFVNAFFQVKDSASLEVRIMN